MKTSKLLKRLIFTAALTLSVGVLAACGSSNNDEKASTGESSRKKQKLQSEQAQCRNHSRIKMNQEN